jgi:HSP20 family protein
MAIGDLVPWRRGGLRRLQDDRTFDTFRHEMESLHRSIDRLFENAWGGSGTSLLSEIWNTRDVMPRLDLVEDDNTFRITAELPGLTDKDVQVSMSDHTLTISGEKKEEKETKDKQVYRSERAYGSFRRVVELPGDIDAGKVKASFANGVLTIEMPKSKEAQEKVRQIPVQTH